MDLKRQLYHTFNHMKDRCYNEKNKSFKNYGGRGITICAEWLESPSKFVDWALQNGYIPGLTIDRINNGEGYSPHNCRWVTLQENNQNRRRSKFYTFNGKTQNLMQWCNEYGMSYAMVLKRIKEGWPFEKAITTPKKQRDTSSLIGVRYGRLTVIEFDSVSINRKSLYKCKCDCGNFIITDKTKLDSGHTRSCGCLFNDYVRELNECHKAGKKWKSNKDTSL